MKSYSIPCALAVALALAAGTPAVLAHDAQHPTAHDTHAAATTAPKLHATLRSLWHGHLVATHDYALAVHANNKAGESKAADAVVANAKEIANAVAGFYGKDAGDGLLILLAGHWGGVKAITDAAHDIRADVQVTRDGAAEVALERAIGQAIAAEQALDPASDPAGQK